MTTLMSFGCRSSACLKFSGFSQRVIRRLSHFGSAAFRFWPARYQWRLLALTLPKMTLFFNTAAAAISATTLPAAPPVPTPVRQMIPPESACWIAVGNHRTNTGAFDNDVWIEVQVQNAAGVIGRAQVAHELRLWPAFDPVQHMDIQFLAFSRSAASRPIGPAPVTSTVLGSQ